MKCGECEYIRPPCGSGWPYDGERCGRTGVVVRSSDAQCELMILRASVAELEAERDRLVQEHMDCPTPGRVKELENHLERVLRRMQEWGAEEDGIPDEAWGDFKRAAVAVRLRAPRCRQGVQECHPGTCFDLQCCDHPEYVATQAQEEEG